MTQTSIDTAHLMKLRLAVARFGEMDRAKWWNTKGMLANLGEMAISRGFPKTHLFARARAVFAVAASRCDEVFDPPNSSTLWRLPPEIEDQIEDAWPGWLESPDEWTEYLNQVNRQTADNLLDLLGNLGLAPADVVERVKRLRRADDARSVLITGVREVDDDTSRCLPPPLIAESPESWPSPTFGWMRWANDGQANPPLFVSGHQGRDDRAHLPGVSALGLGGCVEG